MMMPVLSSSQFLPLLNNKLAWALIGLSAALQVPSVQARWSGMAGALGPPGDVDRTPVPLEPASGEAVEPAVIRRRPGERPEAAGEEVWEPVELARWDLRVSRRFRWTVVVFGIVGAVVFGAVGGSRPTTYTATAGIWVPRVDGTVGSDRVKFDRERLQSALTLGVSGAFAQELIDVAGLDLSVDEVREGLDATRPRMGSYVEISYTDDDRAVVEAVLPNLIDTLDRVYEDARAVSLAQTEDELRPVVPGESRVYTGPAYLDAFPDPEFSVNSPRTAWYVFVGFLVGAIVSAGFLLAGQRRPRVTSTDDLRTHVGYGVWAHVGGTARRRRPTRDQYAQVLATAYAMAPHDEVPHRIVVAPPRTDPQARRLAIGIAAEVVTRGGRALLVDADLHRPGLSARLGGLGRPGLRDVGAEVELAQVIRRVNPLRLPKVARRMVGPAAERLRFVPAGRLRRAGAHAIPLGALDQVDPEVTVIVLAPPTMGEWPTAALLSWSDALVLSATVGLTSTRDLEETAAQAHSSSSAPTGVVLIDG
jgi:Mrp family chromosome partitioning ATPase